MPSPANYIDSLLAQGRVTFTTEQATAALGVSPAAARAAIRRLKRKGVVADPYRGFHVVVPPQHRRLGCRPAEQFLPDLMEHLGEGYYAALLTAARYHGAGHQVPMVFQAMVATRRRALNCGRVQVDFIMRHDMVDTSVVTRNTETGVLRLASPEATALEVVGYPQHCGYLDNVATVLGELSATLDRTALAAEAHRAPTAWVQRLGFLLGEVGASSLSDALAPVLATREVFPVALASWEDMAGAPRDPRWRVAVNVELEPDL
jgi:predicted transcriptional regulator of viral defense system